VVEIIFYPLHGKLTPRNKIDIFTNEMKKIVAALLLLFCGLVVLLATIDLKPYLAPDQTPPIAVENTIKEEITTQTINSKADDPVNNNQPSAPEEEIYPEQEQVVTPLETVEDEVVESEETEPISSSLIELEVTTLPVGEYPFSILLESFAEQATAEEAISFYQERGIPAHWVKVDLGEQGIRYRVFTGIFSTMPEAQQYLDENQLVGKPIKLTYYSARIGVYTDKVQLADAFVKTRDTGVVPYILGTKKGEYHLYVGAFYTYIGAVDQCRDLTAAGVSCEPVKRSTIPPQ
jgi:cell division septation protein DedD